MTDTNTFRCGKCGEAYTAQRWLDGPTGNDQCDGCFAMRDNMKQLRNVLRHCAEISNVSNFDFEVVIDELYDATPGPDILPWIRNDTQYWCETLFRAADQLSPVLEEFLGLVDTKTDER